MDRLDLDTQDKYLKTLQSFSSEVSPKKEQSVTEAFQALKPRLENQEKFEFGDKEQSILKLKLARFFQKEETIDTNTLFDAIIETPGFIKKEKGSLNRLLEVHEEKTLQKIAEARRKRAEVGDKTVANPWENLFTTKSGDYYMARLLNMPHLEKESEYIKHCVGTSDSYINRMKKGEIEILSFRHAPKINPQTHKSEGDYPLMTIEYNLKTKTIEQMKKANDEYLKPDDPFFDDVVDALKELRATKTDTGDLRAFTKISENELQNIKVEDYTVLTENGPIPFREFNPNINGFVFKVGKMELTVQMSKTDVAKIVHILSGVNYNPHEIARNQSEINNETKLYLGPLTSDVIARLIRGEIEVYEDFPNKRVMKRDIIINKNTRPQEYIDKLDIQKIEQTEWTKGMILSPDFIKNSEGQSEKETLVIGTIGSFMGSDKVVTTDDLYRRIEELGFKLCSPRVGLELRLQYQDQPGGEYLFIGMKTISDSDDNQSIFELDCSAGELSLLERWAGPKEHWGSGERFVFAVRK